MLEKKYVRKDKKNRLVFLRNEKKLKVLKFIVFSHNFCILYSELLMKKVSYLIFCRKKFSQTYVRNRCIFSARGRSVYKKFKISRLVLKNFVNNTFASMFNKINN